MTNWKSWGLGRWNDRLLEHFFATDGPCASSPVSTLLVTAEELVRVVGESDATLGGEVRNAFVKAVLEETPANRELLQFTVDNDPRVNFCATVAAVKPPIFVYLIFTCLAAAESSDELGNESSYRQRLQKLSNGRCSGPTLDILPKLWTKFSAWLALPENRRHYRSLILPPTNSHTLIGYSERLAFPHRKDQRQLAHVLQVDDLMGVVPPVGPVLAAVAHNVGSFSAGFRDAFREFQSLYVANPTSPKIFHHQFWSAVVDAALRGREDDNESASISNRIDLVVSFDGEQLQLYLLSTDACRPPVGTRAVPLNDQIGDWKISYPDAATESLHRGGERALDGSIRLGRISDGIRAGLLPLTHAWSDYMVVADDPEELAQAKRALVRADRLDDAIRIFGGRSDGCGMADGKWLVVERMDFKRRPPSDHPFSRLRSMQTRIPINRLFLVGGIPCDDGYLGFKEVLPSVRSPGSRVTMHTKSDVYECGRIGDLWYLPAGQLNGEVKFVSWEHGEQQATLSAHFVSHANSENYKSPKSPEALLIEGARGCVPWSDSPSYSSTDGQDDLGLKTGCVTLLGRNIGEFVNNVADAAWVVTKTGNGSSRIVMADSPVGGLPPEQKLESKSDCRAWSRMLERSEGDFADLQLSAQRSAVHHIIATRAPLPIRTGAARCSAPKPYERKTPPRPEILLPFIAAVAARASDRSGLPMSEWREMATRMLGLNRKAHGSSNDSIDAMTRCWIEAGLLDMGISIRWRSRAIFATRPKLVLFKNGKIISAAVVGLTLPATMKTLCADALNHGAAIEPKSSPCRLVPETHTFISEDIEVFERVAEKNRIKLEWLRTSPGAEIKWAERDRHHPSNYELRYKTDSWSLSGVRSSTTLLTHARDDLPTAWSVEGAPERWSYDRNIARLHACAHAGLEPLLAKGAVEIEAKHCYLPLSLARFAAITGPILPGPETTEYAGQGHIYAFGTASLRDDILQQSKFH